MVWSSVHHVWEYGNPPAGDCGCENAFLRLWVNGVEIASEIRRRCRRKILNSALPIGAVERASVVVVIATERGRLLYLLVCHSSSLGRTIDSNSFNPLCRVVSRV